jgi:probable addiction module antidote protein
MTPTSGNVFTDLRISDAAELDTKVRRAVVVNRLIKKRRLSPAKAAARLQVSQRKLSSLKKYKLDDFSADQLKGFLRALRGDASRRRLMRTRKATKAASPSVPFHAAGHLRNDAEIALYLEQILADGDVRAVPVALRTLADALGGMSALAEKTGLSRETLYRTLSDRGNPRLDILTAILVAFGLRLSVRPAEGASEQSRRALIRASHVRGR